MKKLVASLITASLLVFSTGVAFASPVNINKANAEEIADALNGIGIKKAKDIIAFREKNGPFKSVEQLRDVKGIGEKMLEKNRANIKLQ